MKDKKRPADIYEEQYEKKMREYSELMGGEGEGEDVDLEMHSIDEAFPTAPPAGAPTFRGEKLRFGAGNSGGEGYEPPEERPSPEKKRKKKKSAPKKAEEKPERKRPKKEREEKPRKKRHPVRTFFRTVFILLLIVVIGANLLMYRYISKVDVKPSGARTHTAAKLSDPLIKNILLIGSDSRAEGANGRTDTIILMTINHHKKTITLTSFMRDMYVNISGLDSSGNSYDSWDKINAAYVFGGPELLMDTLEYNFDIDINDYAYVDFYSFIEIVDAVGGIEMKVGDDEAQGMRAPMGEQNKILGNPKGTDYLEGGGDLTLNGNQALAYARLRYVGNADFERTDRQKRVITAIIDKVKRSDPLTVDRFFSTVAENIATNMGRGEMWATCYRGLFSLKYEIKSLRLPAEGDYTYGWHNGGQSTLDVDIEACKALLKKELY